jgi:hypothetical protein
MLFGQSDYKIERAYSVKIDKLMDFSFTISGNTVETSTTSSLPNVGNAGDDSTFTENDNRNNNNY